MARRHGAVAYLARILLTALCSTHVPAMQADENDAAWMRRLRMTECDVTDD